MRRYIAPFLASVLAVCAPVTVSRPAAANVFCPVTIGALADLSILGRTDTYGVLLDFDAGDTSTVRLRIDGERTRYAVDIDDVPTVGNSPLQAMRYFRMPAGEHVLSAFVESTGAAPETRTPCPVTKPYERDAPAPTAAAAIQARDTLRREVRDHFSTKTPVLTPKPFGQFVRASCTEPYAPPRSIAPIAPVAPPEARAVRAGGSVTLRIDLDESAAIVDAVVVRSSGYAPLDRAALAAVKGARYATETFACRSIASSYTTQVTFAP